MNEEDFRALEKFNILYDLAIDEEEYNQGKNKIILHIGGKGQKTDEELLETLGSEVKTDVASFLYNKASFKKVSEITLETESSVSLEALPSDNSVEHAWFNLFLAKRLRALLQRAGNPPGQLDEVARFLLANHAPYPSKTAMSHDYEMNKTLYLVYLNEVSACYKRELSIGYADKAITFIKQTSAIGENIYELLALFNKGRGLQHCHRHSDALDTLNEILSVFDENGELSNSDNANYYISNKSQYRSGKICSEDAALWRKYIYYPTVLTFAEILSDLNRSTEIIGTLDDDWHHETPYKDKWRNVLRADAGIDGDAWDACDITASCDCNIKYCKTLLGGKSAFDDKKYRDKVPILYQKYCSVLLRYDVEKFRRSIICKLRQFREKAKKIEQGSIETFRGQDLLDKIISIEDASSKFKTDFETLLELARAISGDMKNSDKIKQVYLLWLDYYDALNKIRQSIKNAIDIIDKLKPSDKSKDKIKTWRDQLDARAKKIDWKNHKSTIQNIFNSCFKENRRLQDKESRQETFLGLLEDINKSIDNQKYKKLEMDALKIVVYDPKTLEWRKAKYQRRLQVLDPNISDLLYRLPKTCSEKVIEFSEIVYCDKDDGLKCKDRPFKNCTYEFDDDIAGNEPPVTCRANAYYQILRKNTDKFDKQLIYPSVRPIKNSYCLTVLRRWQSFTPALSSGIEINSKGGGYFVYKTGTDGLIEEGIVIDPGFDFLENFQREGFSIRDITAVVMSHAHVDHTVDFIPIISLFAEYNKRTKSKDKKLLAIMSAGCFDKYSQAITQSKEYFCDVIVANYKNGNVKQLPSIDQLEHFTINVRKALHQDYTAYDTLGIIISARQKTPQTETVKPIIGFTGDTRWWEGMEEQYEGIAAMCINLGAIVNVTNREQINRTLNKHEGVEKILRDENHLYWPGFTLLTEKLTNGRKIPKLIIISELGEELKGGLKTDLANQLNETAEQTHFLPEDVGLTIKLLGDISNEPQPKTFCFACGSLVEPKDIEIVPYGKEEATYYVCKACWSYREKMVMEQIKDYHENGWLVKVREDL